MVVCAVFSGGSVLCKCVTQAAQIVSAHAGLTSPLRCLLSSQPRPLGWGILLSPGLILPLWVQAGAAADPRACSVYYEAALQQEAS